MNPLPRRRDSDNAEIAYGLWDGTRIEVINVEKPAEADRWHAGSSNPPFLSRDRVGELLVTSFFVPVATRLSPLDDFAWFDTLVHGEGVDHTVSSSTAADALRTHHQTVVLLSQVLQRQQDPRDVPLTWQITAGWLISLFGGAGMGEMCLRLHVADWRDFVFPVVCAIGLAINLHGFYGRRRAR